MEGGDEVQILGVRPSKCLMLRFVEVIAEFDHLGAETGDGGVLIEGIGAGYIDGRGDPGTRGGKGDGLAMIAASRRDDSRGLWMSTAQPIQVHQSAADFEGASRRMIFVLYPHRGAGAHFQLWPRVLRR